MPRLNKPTPKNLVDIEQSQIEPYLEGKQGKGSSINENNIFSKNRGTDYSMKNDTVKDISIGLEDMDYAIMYYFDNVIKPTVIQDNNKMLVRTLYGSPERWKSVQSDGFYRDANGHVVVPLIMFKRDNIEKNRTIGNKLDGNKVHNYQIVGSKYNIREAYNKFNILNNRIPSEQYYVSTVPDYVTITYNCIIFTNFVEQNNKIVEAIQFASDSYWGDPSRFKFKSRIDSFSTTNIIENNNDKVAKSTFNIILNGYIIPDTVNKDLATVRSKFFTKSQIIFDLETVDSKGKIGDKDVLKFANKPPVQNSLGSTSFVGGGINVTNNNTIISSAASGDLTYLNTNKPLQATTITAPNIATFVGAAILQPVAGSTLPATTVNNFIFYINGQYIPSSAVSLFESGGNVIFTFNVSSIGYNLESDDEVIAIGKFQ